MAAPAPKRRVMPKQSRPENKATATKPQLPTVVPPLYAQDLCPTETERQFIREMYEWEKQSARVQFRLD